MGADVGQRRLDRGDLEAIIALDALAFGATRRQHLLRLFDSSITYGLYDGDRLRAYSMRRRFGRGHVVGPVVATCDADAIRVTHPHVTAHVGGFLRIDTHFDGGAFAFFVQQCGLGVHNTVLTMVTREEAVYGTALDGGPVVYALASHSLG